jgi:hypothetical protein
MRMPDRRAAGRSQRLPLLDYAALHGAAEIAACVYKPRIDSPVPSEPIPELHAAGS